MALTRARAYQILDSDIKQSVRAATTAAVTLSGGAPNTLDTSVTLAAGDRILVKDQSPGSGNGIYVVQTLGTGSNGTWVRASDFDTTSKVTSGLQIYVEEGSTNGDKVFGLTTNNPITLGSTALTFSVLSSAGSASAGGADTNIQYNSSGNFAGSANLTFDGSNVDVAGYLDAGNLRIGAGGNTIQSNNSNGNINLTPNGTGVILANAAITAPTFTSNIGTGTAPFTVTSTTQVANLNVATAGTAGTVTTAAQPNITSVGNLTIANVDNIQIDGNSITSTNTNGNINLTPNGTGEVVAASLTVSDLTSGRIVLAGTSGALTDTSAFTWSGSDITVTGTVTANTFAATTNGTGQNFKVGDDAYIGDVDQADTLNIRGQQNAANGYVVFGNADNTAKLGRAGSGPLTYVGSFETSGTISATRFISNIATGTAPFTVTSTTQVANLNVATAGTAGTVTTAAQPNITSVGTLTSLGVSGTVTASTLVSNIATGTAPFTVTSTTQVANLNVATAGSATTAGTVTTAAQPNITSVGTLTSLGVSGAVTASTLVSNVATGTAPFTVTSTTQVANLNVATAGSATTAGTVTTAAQPNITSVGNLTIANIDNIQIDGNTISSTNTNGNIDISPNGTGNINLNDPVQATSTIQATRFISNIATGTAPFTVTSTTQVANLNVATAGTATTAGTVTTAAQPNITSLGNLTIANIDNIQIDGNTISSTNTNGNIDISPNGTGNINLNDPVQVTSTVQATRFISNITTGTAPFTVTSTTQVANLNVATSGTAGTVTTAAQPNITSVGTLTGLTLSGDITLNSQSDLRFADSDSSNWVAFQAPATIASNVTWTLPATDGSNGNALLTYGNGVLYWGSAGGAGASITTSTTAPGTPADGDLWFDEDDGAVYVYYADGTSNQWVEVGQNTFVSPLTIDNLVLSGSTISTVSNANLTLSPNGTGNVILSALTGNAIVYLTSNKQAISSSNLTYNGSNLTLIGNANIGNIRLGSGTITFSDSTTQTTSGISTSKAFALITIFG